MADPFEGLDAGYAARLKAFLAAAGGRISITSGFRSYERQKQLWNEAVRKYGSPAAARKWVADPDRGKGSNHMHGLAADLRFSNDDARRWAHANAGKYGLHFPMSWEPWHIEPIKTFDDEHLNHDAYTDPPIGVTPAADPHDPATQMVRLLASLDADMSSAFAGATDLGDPFGEAASAMAAAGGQAVFDEGAAAVDYGMAAEPDEQQQLMEELDGDRL